MQIDGAGGHGIGKATDKGAKRGKEFAAFLTSKWKRDKRLAARRYVTIDIIVQPARSPDVNFLDIAVWTSLATGFQVVRVGSDVVDLKSLDHRIIDAFLLRWSQWDSLRHLPGIFSVFRTTLDQIIEHNGGNDFKIRRVTTCTFAFESVTFC